MRFFDEVALIIMFKEGKKITPKSTHSVSACWGVYAAEWVGASSLLYPPDWNPLLGPIERAKGPNFQPVVKGCQLSIFRSLSSASSSARRRSGEANTSSLRNSG